MTNRADDNPNLHIEKNGSTEGWLANVKGMIGLNADAYVTGHGDLLTKADLQRKLDATTARRAKIAAMVKEGKTLDEIKAALPGRSRLRALPLRGAGARLAAGPAAAAAALPPLTFVETAEGRSRVGRPTFTSLIPAKRRRKREGGERGVPVTAVQHGRTSHRRRPRAEDGAVSLRDVRGQVADLSPFDHDRHGATRIVRVLRLRDKRRHGRPAVVVEEGSKKL